METSVKDLGFMNGWDLAAPPKEYAECADDDMHVKNDIVSTQVGGCVTKYFCKKHKISWRIDSSG